MSELVLIVEDEVSLATDLELYLRREGYRTERAASGPQALEMWRAATPDLMLLDLMLPGLDGFSVLRHIRQSSTLPVIVLSALDQEVDRLVGLGLGADDYVVKPYSPREVVARVRAVLRRSVPAGDPPLRQYQWNGLSLNMGSFEVRCHGVPVPVTAGEVHLLAALLQRPGQIRTRSELLRAASSEAMADERSVDTHIKNLRRKLGRCGPLLATVRGAGYLLRPVA